MEENKEMKEIKLTIDGKEVQLTDEQLKILGVVPKRDNPFERAHPAGCYFYIDEHGRVKGHYDTRLPYEEKTYDAVNYFNDEAFANQVALHQLLYRKLLKFAYDNGYEDTAEWDGNSEHFLIYYNVKNKDFNVSINCNIKSASIYFNSRRAAKRAVEEVVKPFMKEHPDFVW